MPKLSSASRAVSKTAKGASVRLRAANFQDHEQITKLEARFGLGARSYSDWSHLWLANPAFRELQGDWPIGWVVEDENRQIIASLASIPLHYELEGRRILAATGKALVAEPAYRNACLMLLDRLINQTPVDLYLNNTVGESSVALVDLLQCPR